MREIKFRSWNERMKQMYYGEEVCLILNRDTNCYEGIVYYCKEDEREEIMQFTGLKDKNGVEIYEGDIVKWFNGDNLVVHWNDTHPRFMLGKDAMTRGDAMGSVVMGNIYENPELLEA